MPIIALLLTVATPDAAVDAGADARCAYVLSFVGQGGGGAASTPSAAGMLYFVGKLRGRDPGVDVDAAVSIAGAAARRAGLDPRAELGRCVAELRSTDAIAAALRARTTAAPPHATTM